jgi:2-dehydropantoate 2-reductase
MRERGLRIESPNGDLHLPTVNATDDPATIGPVDIVFFAVKLYDTNDAVKMLPPLIGPQTIVIPFQNGVESVRVLTQAVGKQHVAGGAAYVAAVIAEPGLIRHTAMNRLVFGPVAGQPSPLLKELLEICTRAGIDATLSDHIQVDIWSKFVRLTAYSAMTAVTRSPIGPVRQDHDLRTMMETLLHESITVARSRQIPLPSSTFAEAVAATDALPATARSSMLEDLERGRPLELPWLSGGIVRIAEEVGVSVPTHRLVVALLRPHAHGHT